MQGNTERSVPVITSDQWWKIFACRGTSLAPSLLLLAKLLVFVTIIIGFPFKFPQPFVPFLQVFDLFPGAVFQWALRITFWIAAIHLFANRRVRTACVTLGLVLIVAVLASRHFYSNGKVFCGLVFLMVGLQPRSTRPWLLHLQLALVYLGAGVNKLFEPDWRSGQFFEFFLTELRPRPVYQAAAALLPDMMLSWLMCWFVILFEFCFGFAILFGRKQAATIWCGVLFHSAALYLTGSMYGVFVPAMFTAYLSFIAWPSEVKVSYSPRQEWLSRARHLSAAIDVDDLCSWKACSDDTAAVMEVGGRRLTGLDVYRRLVFYHPLFYFAFAFFFISPMMDTIYRDTILAAAILFFSPVMDVLQARPRISGRGMAS